MVKVDVHRTQQLLVDVEGAPPRRRRVAAASPPRRGLVDAPLHVAGGGTTAAGRRLSRRLSEA